MAIIIMIPNEVAMIIVGLNSLYMFTVTLGSPIWTAKKKTMFPPLYGKNQKKTDFG